MKTLSYFLITASILGFSINSQAASIYAGKAKAAAVCSQCHGIRSTSAEAPFPSLAGRDKKYLESALKQYRDKTRISDIMNNIASYYSRLKP